MGIDAIKAIQELPAKTLSAKLEILMPDIEERIKSGVSHEEILNALNKSGFDLKLTTFRTYLFRYRKKVKAGKNKAAMKPVTSENFTSEIPQNVGSDNNGNLESHSLAVESTPVENDVSSERNIDEILDARTRDQLGDKYVNQKRKIFRNKQE